MLLLICNSYFYFHFLSLLVLSKSGQSFEAKLLIKSRQGVNLKNKKVWYVLQNQSFIWGHISISILLYGTNSKCTKLFIRIHSQIEILPLIERSNKTYSPQSSVNPFPGNENFLEITSSQLHCCIF